MKITTLLFSLLVLAAPIASSAQEYHDITADASIVCAFFGDGTNKIFLRDGGNLDLISFEDASKPISKKLTKARTRLRNLNRSKREQEALVPRNEETITQLKRAIKKTKNIVGLRESELRALEDCRDDFRFDGNTIFSFKPVVYSHSGGLTVSMLVTTVRKIKRNNDSERTYCFYPIDPADDFYSTDPQSKEFSTNPCSRFSEDCSNLLDGKTKLGYLYYFDDVANNEDEIASAMQFLQDTFGNGFGGRPERGPFDDCSDS